MVTEDLDKLPGSLAEKIEASGICTNDVDRGEVNIDVTEENLRVETFSIFNVDVCCDLAVDNSDVDMEVDPAEPLRLLEENNVVGVGLTSENGYPSLARMNDATEDGAHAISTSSRKRPRKEDGDIDQPSVHVTYKSLRSSSKQKLEELLKQWSKWHAEHCSTFLDTSEEVHSGEETFFPALQVGVEKPSTVLFWIDQQTLRTEDEGVISFDSKTVPLYDRGYSLGLNTEDYSNNLKGGLEIMDKVARCFNCGSYSHSLKDCPKPRDNVTINNARKQQGFKIKQNAATRSTPRYYQDTPFGKFNGFKPGTLDSETRKLLGLGELDPPPWLNKMRELGYPPGYLEVDVDDQPSGIIMFANEVAKADDMDGEIAETGTEPPKKKTVKFAGINAPIPENADEGHWADVPSRSKSSSHQSHVRTNQFSFPISIPCVQNHRLPGYMRDDPPPGTESVLSPLPFPNSAVSSCVLSQSLDSYERGRMSHYEDYSRRGYASRGRVGQYSPPLHDNRYGQSVEMSRHYYDRDCPVADWHSSNFGHRPDMDYPREGWRYCSHGHHSWR